LNRKTSLLWFAGGFAALSMSACQEQPASWVDQCVKDTRASHEFCECLDERRVVREGKIVVGSGKFSTGGRIDPPLYREPGLEDQKTCRAMIIQRIDRQEPLK